MQKILVTGGAGYLGSLLTPLLLKRNFEVVILDNFLWGVKPILHIANHPKLTIHKGDVRDYKLLQKLISQVDIVINLAAIVGFPACSANPIEARSINLDAVREIGKLLSSDQMFIQASTGSTYGAVDHICTEDTPINPLTLYGETKAASEEPTLERDGIPLRFATVFGLSPRMRLDLIVNDIAYQAVKYGSFVMYEGHARRTFLHSTDAAKSIIFAIDNYDKMKGKPYNVGDESLNYTKREIANLIKSKHDFYLHEAEFGTDKDKRDYEVSYERIKELGFNAEVSIEQGISELLKILPLISESSSFRNIR